MQIHAPLSLLTNNNNPKPTPIKSVTADFALVFSNIGVMRCPFDSNGEILGGTWINEAGLIDVISQKSRIYRKQIKEKNLANKKIELISENVLFENDDVIVWYTESNLKMPQFYTSHTLNPVPHPQLIFCASKRINKLFVVATAEKIRPTLQTLIFNAPLANLYRDSHLCLGSAVMPSLRSQSTISKMEDCLFNSRYSGFKFDPITLKMNIKNTMRDFWSNLQGKKTFPVKKLTPLENTKLKSIEDWLIFCIKNVGGDC